MNPRSALCAFDGTWVLGEPSGNSSSPVLKVYRIYMYNLSTTLFLMLYWRQVVEGVTVCTLD